MKKKVVIWLHGLGASGQNFLPIVDLMPELKKSQTKFIFPDAPKRPITINNDMIMPAWFDIVSFSTFYPEDKSGILSSSLIIQKLIDQEIESGVDPKDIHIIGFSQGGAMALYTGLHQKQTIGSIICLSGFLPLSKDNSSYKDIIKSPILMHHGNQDDVVHIGLARMSKDFLEKQLDCNINYREFNSQHIIIPEQIPIIEKFILDSA